MSTKPASPFNLGSGLPQPPVATAMEPAIENMEPAMERPAIAPLCAFCGVPIPGRFALCGRHWAMISPAVQSTIRRYEPLGADSVQYRGAVDMAVRFLKIKARFQASSSDRSSVSRASKNNESNESEIL